MAITIIDGKIQSKKKEVCDVQAAGRPARLLMS